MLHRKTANNKALSNTLKPFLTSGGFLTSDSISLTQENETITDKKKNNTLSQFSLRKYCEKIIR